MNTLYTHLCTYQIIITGIAETKWVLKKYLPPLALYLYTCLIVSTSQM